MPNIVARPHRELVLAVRRGTFTVPDAVATVNCNCAFRLPCEGLVLTSLPQESWELAKVARERAKTMAARLAVRGQRLIGDLRLHGPWISYNFEQHLVDADSSAWDQARKQERGDGVYEDPSALLPMVFERDAALPMSDYLLVGYFEMQEAGFDEPVVMDRSKYPW